MTDKKLTPQDKDFVNSLANGLQVLLAFNSEAQGMTLTEVAERTNMDRAKARRFLMTLESLGYVKKNARVFELTPKVLELGYCYHAAGQSQSIIQHYLNLITEQIDESSSLAELDGDEVVYVLRSSAAHRLMSINLNIGTRLPAAYTSMGRMLLSQLDAESLDTWLKRCSLEAHTSKSVITTDALKEAIDEAGKAGYCIVDQELDLGLRSIAVAVYSRDNQLIGAINISTNASRVAKAQLVEKYLPLLQEAAEQIQKHAV